MCGSYSRSIESKFNNDTEDHISLFSTEMIINKDENNKQVGIQKANERLGTRSQPCGRIINKISTQCLHNGRGRTQHYARIFSTIYLKTIEEKLIFVMFDFL